MLILTSYLELENDRWTVETSFVFNVNFYYQISFEKFVDSYFSTFWGKLVCCPYAKITCDLRVVVQGAS